MAKVVLAIGGRNYHITCRDGGEAHLQTLARVVDAKVEEARVAVGTADEVRQLLFAALLLADQAGGSVPSSVPADPDPAIGDALARLADRIERFAETLENTAPSA